MRTSGNTGKTRWKVDVFVLMQVRDQLGVGTSSRVVTTAAVRDTGSIQREWA